MALNSSLRAPEEVRAAVPPILLVLAAALLWSTGGLFIKSTPLTAYELSLGRSLLAALTVAWFTRREGFGLNGVTVIASVLYAALLLLFVIANKLTTAANAIFLQYTAPVYVMLFEPLMYREKFRARDFVVVLCCVGGMSLFFVGQLRPQDVSGNFAALASGLCFAFFLLLLRHPHAARVNRASSVIYGNVLLCVLCAALLWGDAVPGFIRDGGIIGAKDVVVVAYLGVVQIGLAYTLFTLGIARGVRALDADVVGYVEPVLNPVWVAVFIGERPSAWAMLGGAIIIAAVLTHTGMSAKSKAQARLAA
ncbi:MAG: EamA family transporter [Pyrinomonadaceae bacterium]